MDSESEVGFGLRTLLVEMQLQRKSRFFRFLLQPVPDTSLERTGHVKTERMAGR